jgi:hypothetical protein
MQMFKVFVQRSYVYEVEAEDYDAAIDAVCNGEGDEVDCETMDMFAEEK